MKPRDLAIISDLHKFRCMSRDDIAYIHFGHTKNPITSANFVLKRLRRDGHIDANTTHQPYVYFAADSKMKRNSQKIAHFLGITAFYRDLVTFDKPYVFEVEPKLSDKGAPEPDAFTIWKGTPFYIEIQRSQYTDKQWEAKVTRYESYYYGREWEQAEWQPKGKTPIFPIIWTVGEVAPKASENLRIIQTKNAAELVNAAQRKKKAGAN